MKQLYRSEDNKVLAGIMGGFGEYFDIDPTLLRVVGIVLFVITGFFPVALIYLILIFVIPAESETVRVIDIDEEQD